VLLLIGPSDGRRQDSKIDECLHAYREIPGTFYIARGERMRDFRAAELWRIDLPVVDSGLEFRPEYGGSGAAGHRHGLVTPGGTKINLERTADRFEHCPVGRGKRRVGSQLGDDPQLTSTFGAHRTGLPRWSLG
jgi:hypothetical protein